VIRKARSAAKWVRGMLFRRATTLRHNGALAAINTREVFEAYVAETRPPLFLRYRGVAAEKRQDFASVLDALDLDLSGKSILDIGPAHGDSLDVAHERGAALIEFVEFEPFFYKHNELKPYASGYKIDHRRKLATLPPGRFDLIWCKGGFSPDFFVRFGALFPLSRWLNEVERLARSNATLLICPGWTNDGISRNIEDLNANPFTKTMQAHGYAMLAPIPNHNHEPDYPVTYCKKVMP
jgi:hypothetical protein